MIKFVKDVDMLYLRFHTNKLEILCERSPRAKPDDIFDNLIGNWFKYRNTSHQSTLIFSRSFEPAKINVYDLNVHLIVSPPLSSHASKRYVDIHIIIEPLEEFFKPTASSFKNLIYGPLYMYHMCEHN